MLDPLGALVITFVVMAVISVIGVVLLHLSKNEKLQKGLFYFLAVWGMIITYCSVISTPGYMTGELMISWGLGALSVIALLIQLCSKKVNKFKIAKILVTISVVAGMIDCFVI